MHQTVVVEPPYCAQNLTIRALYYVTHIMYQQLKLHVIIPIFIGFKEIQTHYIVQPSLIIVWGFNILHQYLNMIL